MYYHDPSLIVQYWVTFDLETEIDFHKYKTCPQCELISVQRKTCPIAQGKWILLDRASDFCS